MTDDRLPPPVAERHQVNVLTVAQRSRIGYPRGFKLGKACAEAHPRVVASGERPPEMLGDGRRR